MKRLALEPGPAAYRLLRAPYLTLLITACAPLRTTINPGVSPEVEHSWEVSFNQGDTNAVAALYAADAQLVMSGAAPICGVTDIYCAIEDMINSGVKVRI